MAEGQPQKRCPLKCLRSEAVQGGVSACTQRRPWLVMLWAVAAALGACDSADNPPPAPVPSTIQNATPLNLYPAQTATGDDRLYILVSAVGYKSVRMPLGFDTGSAGITLYAPDIFSPEVLTSSGFVFPPGQSTLTFAGITVTNQQGVRVYGGAGGHSEIGNIGFATVSFGDSSTHLTTRAMPVFLYYQVTSNSTGKPATVPPQHGWFGVNTNADVIATGTTEPLEGYPACALGVIGSCRVVSVLKYLSYASGLNAGFILNPASLQSCDIATPGSCLPQPMLTVGLTIAAESPFSTWNLTCPPNNYVGPQMIQGYPVCAPTIPESVVTIPGAGALRENVVFDSGNPQMLFYEKMLTVPSPLAAGTTVLIQTPSGFSYEYLTTAGGDAETFVTTAGMNGVGIHYFTTNSFFIDLVDGSEGWH